MPHIGGQHGFTTDGVLIPRVAAMMMGNVLPTGRSAREAGVLDAVGAHLSNAVAASVHGSGYERIAGPGCSDRTIRRRLKTWAAGDRRAGACAGAAAYDQMIGSELGDVAVDGCITKAPGGGDCAGPSPVDRRKGGLKRSVATEEAGIPLASPPRALVLGRPQMLSTAQISSRILLVGHTTNPLLDAELLLRCGAAVLLRRATAMAGWAAIMVSSSGESQWP